MSTEGYCIVVPDVTGWGGDLGVSTEGYSIVLLLVLHDVMGWGRGLGVSTEGYTYSST